MASDQGPAWTKRQWSRRERCYGVPGHWPSACSVCSAQRAEPRSRAVAARRSERRQSLKTEIGDPLRMYVSEKAASMGGLQGLRVGVHVRHGDPMREIIQAAVELDVDLIVLGSPQHPHLKSLIVGTIAEKLPAHSPCPVALAGPKPIEPLVHHPAIEPPCPDCVKARAQSDGREWWCTRHATHGATTGGHVYSTNASYRLHNSTLPSSPGHSILRRRGLIAPLFGGPSSPTGDGADSRLASD
jgi:nucleotide-binding universal stress UspA family protein